MDAFRRDVANFSGLEDDMTPEQDTRLKNIETALGASGASGPKPLADNRTALAVLWAIQAALADLKSSAGTSSGSKVQLPTEFDVPSFAALVAAKVVEIENKQARDGDPATGPVS